jgi:hypothetical protein
MRLSEASRRYGHHNLTLAQKPVLAGKPHFFRGTTPRAWPPAASFHGLHDVAGNR